MRRGPGVAVIAALAAWPVAPSSQAQTPFWTETFDNACRQLCPGDGYTGTNGRWTVADVSAPGSDANIWYVSCAENGNAAGACGSGCGNDASLHVGNVPTSPAAFLFCPTGDCGAAYDASDQSCVADKRAMSPVIDATGRTGLSAEFVFLGGGQPCSDSADFEYSPDGGLNWSVLAACLRSSNGGCFGQGRWGTQTVALPASADNNPQIRLGFRWYNDGDGLGNDPSFAVDDLVVRHTPGTATGACCKTTLCTTETLADCLAAAGTYQGDNVPCSPDPCAVPCALNRSDGDITFPPLSPARTISPSWVYVLSCGSRDQRLPFLQDPAPASGRDQGPIAAAGGTLVLYQLSCACVPTDRLCLVKDPGRTNLVMHYCP